jgi:hypothetical protein
MDNITSGGIGASVVVGLGICYKIYQAINHKKFKSTCMNKEFSASIDIDETTPKKELAIRVDGVANRTDPVRDKSEDRPPISQNEIPHLQTSCNIPNPR